MPFFSLVALPIFLSDLNLTLERVGTDCDHGGPLDICAICKVLHCDANLHLGSDWIENRPRLTAIRWDIAGRKQVMVTLPGGRNSCLLCRSLTFSLPVEAEYY